MPISPEKARENIEPDLNVLRDAYYPALDNSLVEAIRIDEWPFKWFPPSDMPKWFRRCLVKDYTDAGWYIDEEWEGENITFEPS